MLDQNSFELVASLNRFDTKMISSDGFTLCGFSWTEEKKYKPWVVSRDNKKYRVSYMFCFERFRHHTQYELEMQQKPIRKRRR